MTTPPCASYSKSQAVTRNNCRNFAMVHVGQSQKFSYNKFCNILRCLSGRLFDANLDDALASCDWLNLDPLDDGRVFPGSRYRAVGDDCRAGTANVYAHSE